MKKLCLLFIFLSSVIVLASFENSEIQGIVQGTATEAIDGVVYQYAMIPGREKEICITKITSNQSVVSIPSQISGNTVTTIGAGELDYDDCPREERELLSAPRSDAGEKLKKTYRVLQENSQVKKIVIPQTVKWIKMCAFYESASIQEVTLSKGLLEIGAEAFGGCTGIRKVVIPQSVQTIWDSFAGCTGIKKVVVNSEKVQIGARAFQGITGKVVFASKKTQNMQDIFFNGRTIRKKFPLLHGKKD
ncbi:MAG: leucine-rich repeat domain-containing protein [Lachnospiraceae bacterium]|nr:leucine-rich repeat domain-containing protein [Lachnospiraceae bacterium]